MKNLLKEVKGNIYGLGVYCFKDGDRVLYVGSGMMNDRLQSHLYNLKRGLYEENNKRILQHTYNCGNLIFEVLHFSENNSEYINGNDSQRQAIQRALEVLEKVYIDIYKDTICNKMKRVTKFTTSPNEEVSIKRSYSNVGANNPNSRLKEKDVKQIKRLAEEGLSCVEIAQMFGVSITHINNINKGLRWAYVM